MREPEDCRARNAAEGTTGECDEFEISFARDDDESGANYGGATGTMEKCLSSIVGSSFQRIAAKESNTSRVGFAYGAFQLLGTYMQWPGLEWCPLGYDPRYRPWYAAAAAGPKDVVIVVDVSGSMTGTRIGMARDAAKAVLNTLTETDYATVIVFSSRADAYSTTLVQATEENKELMESWINSNVLAGGGTDFNAALSKAKEVLNNGGGTGCNKVVLFMSDGEPEEAPDVDALTRDLDAIGNVRLMTYALGDGAQADVLHSMACGNKGVFQAVPDNGDLAYAMAMYYQVLAPSLAPCQTRYTEYTDLVSGKKLLAACTPAYNKSSSSAENSCNGGLDGIGDSGSPQVAQLLGVVCMDMDMIVPLDVLKSRTPRYAASLVRRVGRRREASVNAVCSRVTVSDTQLETIRAKVSRESVCDWSSYCTAVAGDEEKQRGGLGGRRVRRRSDRLDVGAIIGGAAAGGAVFLLCVLVCLCMAARRRAPPSGAAKATAPTPAPAPAAMAPAAQAYAAQPTAVAQAHVRAADGGGAAHVHGAADGGGAADGARQPGAGGGVRPAGRHHDGEAGRVRGETGRERVGRAGGEKRRAAAAPRGARQYSLCVRNSCAS